MIALPCDVIALPCDVIALSCDVIALPCNVIALSSPVTYLCVLPPASRQSPSLSGPSSPTYTA
eukprot:1182532-Rhodomonas_salina.1